ncbi:hypothetical protein C1H46_002172 [Malus baccata]|uniref:Uncharacterized protein n=1 Tax=Malus baccata TaxID=106549 RepID=A0A540NMK2_MALBA|nr:hypothetical protein C1H46_002172 [Malus baccata]
MACVGFFFGCKRHRSVRSYVVSALAIIGILFGLRVLCYIICKLCFKREHDNPRSPRLEQNPNDRLEMQSPETRDQHPAAAVNRY